MIDALQRGDEVITTGGIHGKITGVTEDVLTVEIDKENKVKIRVQKQAVANVTKSG